MGSTSAEPVETKPAEDKEKLEQQRQRTDRSESPDFEPAGGRPFVAESTNNPRFRIGQYVRFVSPPSPQNSTDTFRVNQVINGMYQLVDDTGVVRGIYRQEDLTVVT